MKAQAERTETFSPAELTERAIQRRAVEAVIWGVPVVNYDLMYQAMVKAKGAFNQILYYYESRISVVRMGPWKIHMTTREDYYAEIANRVLFFNVRSDPFESYDNKDSAGHMMQRMSWLFQPMSGLIEDHLKTLAKYRPVQGGASFDMSNVVEEFLEKTMTATAQ